MQRLRTTFARSRTPTGAEMKTQTSLEVPKQTRSASFDEMQLEAQRAILKQHVSSDDTSTTALLQVPQSYQQQRSHSFDSAAGSDDSGAFLEVPGGGSGGSGASSNSGGGISASGPPTGAATSSSSMSSLKNRSTFNSFNIGRRASASVVQSKAPPACWHCYYLAQYERQVSIEQRFFIDHHELKSLSYSDSSSYSSDPDNEDEDNDDCIIGELSSKRHDDDSEDEGVDAEHNTETDDCRTSPQFGSTLLPPLSQCNITFTLSPINGDFPKEFPPVPSPPLVIPPTEFSSYGPAFESGNSPPFSPAFHPSPPPSPLPSSSYLGYTPNQQEQNKYQSNQLQSPSIELSSSVFDEAIITNLSSSPPQPPPELQFRPRRRSISRQEAIVVEPGSSLENVCSEDHQGDGGCDGGGGTIRSIEITYDPTEKPPTLSASTSAASTEDQETSIDLSSSISIRVLEKPILPILMTENLVDNVRDIYLTVPDLKRDRAASVDSCFSKLSSGGKTEEVQPGEPGCFLSVPNINATRSRSVDIVLPTDEQARYKALALTAVGGIYGRSTGGGIKRQIRIVPDWSENAINGDHLWVATSASGDLCAVPEECRKSGQRMKCSACQLVAHMNCIPVVNEKTQLQCKPTFRDVGVRQYREQTQTHHHWVHRRQEKSKCKACSRAFQGKLFGSKEVVALSCAWCKTSYHNKESCFNPDRIGEECSMGAHKTIVVPPAWIVKLPGKGNFKSSLRTQKKKANSKRNRPDREDKQQKSFIVKPIPGTSITPVIVFINPKSGGNQGVKLLGKFQWLLNPRQVFDLTQGGPKMGLELFRKAPNLRILACGGDGTVGWVLSILDVINVHPQPAVGVLPLGTGNDLARALGWGGGYTDEPVGKILMNIGRSDSVYLDRWSLKVTPNPNAEPRNDGKDNLPLNVCNNYFSFGVDAHIALEFHEAREAHPERFNSRIRNKMFYGTAGGKDLLQRKWRSLSNFVTMECDGTDYTKKLKDSGVHAILFLNIPSYGGGTHPWNNSAGQPPATDDGLIEVVGLTTYQLPMLQAGAHGTCICQCKTAKIVTSKTIPMQVDGEACRVKPSIIEVSLLNKAVLLAKSKRGRPSVQIPGQGSLNLKIIRITMPNYEKYHYDKDMLKTTGINLGVIEVEPTSDLEQTRNLINKYLEDSTNYPGLSQDWCFVDSCTAERFFRIDRAQEHLHYIMDIASEEIFILDQECATMPQTPDQERSFQQFQQRQEQNDRGGGGQNNAGLSNKTTTVTALKLKSNVLEKTSDAVLLAAKSDDLLMIRLLHERGYSLLAVDSNGQTALHIASRNNFKNVIRYLISCAPRTIINMVDTEKGQTALHLAAANKHRDVCAMLVAAGASLSIRDHFGNTPMMIAFNENAHDLAAYLESQERFYTMDMNMNQAMNEETE